MKCVTCKGVMNSSAMRYGVKKLHDGQMYVFTIEDLPIWKCQNCGEVLFDCKSDIAISNALRDIVGLMYPEDIKAHRESLKMSREELAVKLHIPLNSDLIRQIEEGLIIQSKQVDQRLRLALPFTAQ